MKKQWKYLTVPIALITMLLLFVGTGYAQGQGVISAQVNRTSLSTDETLTLSVIVNSTDMSVPSPQLPDLQGFMIVGTGKATQMSIINGAINTQGAYTYRLQPLQAGDLVIPSISATVNGQTFNTDPINIQVTQGTGTTQSAQSAPNPTQPTTSEFRGQDYYVEAEVDNPNPYLGEQITYTFRFYRAKSLLSQPQYQAPTFSGFWSEEDVAQTSYNVQAANKIYQVTELQTILFPSVVGETMIGPATLTIPGGLFSSGATLATEAVAVNVKPLPANAPASFSGAVGQYNISATVDSTQGKVNEPLTWQVTLSGQGNIRNTPDPAWPELSEWRDFESEASINTQTQDGKVVGSRVYERLMVPTRDGELTIPSLEYSYFDPTAGAYQTISAAPIAVSIIPGEAGASAQYSAEVGDEVVLQAENDIHHLKPVPAQLAVDRQALTNSPLYWLLWGVPLVGMVGFTAWQRRQQYWLNNAHIARSSKARKKAQQALSRLKKQSNANTYSATEQILLTYIGEKLHQPVGGLTYNALAERLQENGVSAELATEVQDCLTLCEMSGYAPDGEKFTDKTSLIKDVSAVISKLEKSL